MIEILWLIILALGTLCIGREIQRRIHPTTEPLLDILLSFALGSGTLILVMYALGWLGWMRPLHVITTTALLFVTTIRNITWLLAAIRSLDYTWMRQKPMLCAVFLAFAALNLIGALAPTTDSDGLGYHLAIPKYYLESGGFAYHPMIVSTWPLTTEMMYTLALAISGDVLAKLVHYAFGILAALATYWLARRLAGHDIGVLAAVIFYTIPLIAIESGIAYNDLAMTFYFVLGFGLWLSWILDDVKGSFLAAAIVLGLFASTKWNGPVSIMILTLMTTWMKRSQLRMSLRQIAGFVSITASFSVMWYVKNWIINGNPLGPFAESLFDGVNWTVAHSLAYLASVKSLDLSLSHFFLAPIKLFLMPSQYGELTFLGPILLMLAPIGFALWRTRESLTILTFAAFSYVFWWATSQQSRLLIPIFTLLAIVSAQTAHDERLTRVRTPILCIILVSMLLNLAFPIAYHGKAVGYILGVEDRDAYLERIRPVYPAMQYINTHTPPNSTVVMLGEIHAYWLLRPYLFECAAMQGVINYEETPQEIYDRMKSMGVTHLLLNHNVPFCDGMEKKLAQEPFLGSLRPEFSRNNVEVVTLL